MHTQSNLEPMKQGSRKNDKESKKSANQLSGASSSSEDSSLQAVLCRSNMGYGLNPAEPH